MYSGSSPGCGCNQRPGETSGLGIAPAIIGAGAALIGPLSKLFGGKPEHMSPWGFHVDDYSAHILDAERQIVALKNQIAQILRQTPPMFPQTPWPPATPGAFSNATKQAWYDTMRPVVAQYSAQSDCVTSNNQVNPGGCYEQTYSAQLNIINQLKSQLAQAQSSSQFQIPMPGSASIINPNYGPASQYQGVPLVASQYYPGTNIPMPGATGMLPMAPSSIPRAPSTIQMPQSYPQNQGVFGADMSNWLIIGAGVIGFVMIMSAQRSAPKSAKGKK
jgi:hypothetical protein